MATYLPGSGALSISAINSVFGRGNNLNSYRGTTYYTSSSGPFTFSSGAISMSSFYGTGPSPNRTTLSYTFSSSTANASLNVTSIGGYTAGTSDITIYVNSGVYLYATSTGNAGLSLSGGTTGDTVTLVNNGFIMGRGGNGGGNGPVSATSGGPALSLGFNTTVNNTNGSAYIGGGGGGGQYNQSIAQPGGGGAGGGTGGNTAYNGLGGAGGGIGSSGANGTIGVVSYKGNTYYGGGGGGGRIFPGSGGAGGISNSSTNANGKGGGSGGGGGQTSAQAPGNRGGNGGSANAAGENGVRITYNFEAGGGGGGGWGASGGSAPYTGAGGSGGRAVALNGRSITWVSGNTSRVYGSVS